MDSRIQLEMSALIRESYTRLPFQKFWTWLTGKERAISPSSRRINPIEPVFWSLTLLVSGILGSVLILFCHLNLLWLPMTFLLTVSGARYIVATIIHHGVHNAVFKTEFANRILCEILSTLIVVQPFDSYKKFHVYEHHGRDFSTLNDQDLATIYSLGLRPGIPILRMKWLLAWQCINPMFHLRFMFGRVKNNLIDVPFYRLIMSCLWFGTLAWIGTVVGPYVFIIAIIMPCTIIYQICSLLHLVTEHAWVLRQSEETVRTSHVKNSHARFCGGALPSKELRGIKRFSAWSSWWLLHFLLHLPTRMLIVQGSLVVHDWHHRSGSDRGWPNAIQKREKDLQREMACDLYTYYDMWGIHNVINDVMQRIYDAPNLNTTEELKCRLN